MNRVRLYGADWCDDTKATLNHLDSLGVQYEYMNIDTEPGAAEWVKSKNGGKQKLPTLDLDGQILTMPTEPDLEQALRSKGLMG